MSCEPLKGILDKKITKWIYLAHIQSLSSKLAKFKVQGSKCNPFKVQWVEMHFTLNKSQITPTLWCTPKFRAKKIKGKCGFSNLNHHCYWCFLQACEDDPFIDVGHGPWKQGWRVGYKGDVWDSEKLKVFVVPLIPVRHIYLIPLFFYLENLIPLLTLF